jgi:hypothetical protein
MGGLFLNRNSIYIMVRKLVGGILLCILFNSCICYRGDRTEFGLPRKSIKGYDKENTKMDAFPIDTSCVYKLTIDFHYSTSTKTYSYFEKSELNNYPYISYLKFYPEGKVGLFVIAKSDTILLDRTYFNPKKAKMGYYTVHNGLIRTRIFTDGDCDVIISENKGKAKNDSLILSNKNNHGHIYIKSNVPPDLLNWKPDW